MKVEFTEDEEQKIFNLVSQFVSTNRLAEQKSRLIINNIKKRMHLNHYNSLQEYLDFAMEDINEKNYLLSNLTIHTTYWFREIVNLELFESWVQNYGNLRKRLKGLSIGCSTGQEVFSMALILAEKGIEFEITGLDVDPVSIETAQKGVYPISEFSSIPRKYDQFLMIGDGRTAGLFTLNKEVRKKCHFKVENIETANLEVNHYDFIICRNMLIYFDGRQVNKIIQKISESLIEEGLLILGVSEPLMNSVKGLISLKPAIFQKISSKNISCTLKGTQKKIALIIDESEQDLNRLIKILYSDQYEMRAARSLEEAKSVMEKEHIDVVSMDANLDPTGELRWLQDIRKSGNNIPFAVLSDNKNSENSNYFKLFSAGVTEFFPKEILKGDITNFLIFMHTFLGVVAESDKKKHRQTILVVDDNKDICDLLFSLLKGHNLHVYSFTSSFEALEFLKKNSVDAVLSDYKMPDTDGIDFIRQAREIHPGVPALLVSGALANKDYLKNKMGIDVLHKPINEISLVRAVTSLLYSRPKKIVFDFFQNQIFSCIVIGASTGGPQTLKRILSHVSINIPPIVIVQHIPNKFQEKFFQDLADNCGLGYKSVDQEMELDRGCIYSSQPGFHVCVKQKGHKILAYPVEGNDGSGHTPSVNQLFKSASLLLDKCVAILLTGMGSDGAQALKDMKNNGHYTIAQDESSIVYGMPKAAVEYGAACFSASDSEIQQLLSNISCISVKKIS